MNKFRRAPASILITCEHARNTVPRALAGEFSSAEAQKTLHSHRGYDAGARAIARIVYGELGGSLYEGQYSRLVIDLNRSANHPKVFSEWTRSLSPRMRERLIEKIHQPYREAVKDAVATSARSRRATTHFSIHSFTPRLHGHTRNCEIGLLYDPQRHPEARLARKLKSELRSGLPGCRIRMNYPYRGSDDGHTTSLRGLLPPSLYSGIEIEFNQAWIRKLVSENRLIPTAKTVSRIIRETVQGSRR